ncbi:DVUA0089 family protein [Desulfovibrio psychrotolerans]|uniref:PEP-CTERM domain protein n=1 Tax=Desulfovibrio psychrotolerans TaxID=415242 RepID=A0A7J0BRV5_9BACT|nr:DVUA0089 family protein [Desulfovibrio psychrotolerans]GFM35912.1 PEP-CTERM domain protein [Desulfovibrio psychrotolerans]
MRRTLYFIVVGLLAITASTAKAADYDYFGTIRYHNEILQFNFSVLTSDTRTFFSSSWDDGGFDPTLALWDEFGNIIALQDDGLYTGSTTSNGVSYTHGVWDTFLSVFLDPGNYILTMTVYNNFNNGTNLSDGFFLQDEYPILLTALEPSAYGVNQDFYAFHILNVETATGPGGPIPTPEPSAFLLFGSGIIGLIVFTRRNRVATK